MNESARERWPEEIALVSFAALMVFLCLWREPLSGVDEVRVAGIAREMALTGEYAVPHLNGQPFLEFPGLGYLPSAFLFGLSNEPSDLLAHLPAALFGLGTVLLTYQMGRLLGGRRRGVVAGFALLSTAGFAGTLSLALVDPALLFFVTCSLYGYLAIDRGVAAFPWHHVLFYGGAAAAFLTKGLIGVAIVASVSGVSLLLRRDWAAWRALRFGWGLLFFALPLSLWGAFVVREAGVEALWEFFRQSVWRFSSSTTIHSRPFHFYALPILIRLLPWTPLFLFLLWLRVGKPKWKAGLSLRGVERFPAIWFVVVFLGLSVASAKRQLYLAPIYPAFALLCALWWGRIRERYGIGRRTEFSLIVLFVATFAVLRLTVLVPQRASAIWSPMMASVRHEARAGELVLYHPIEGVRGAAVFYLGTTVPVAEDPTQLSTRLASRERSTTLLIMDEDLAEVRERFAPMTLVTESSWTIKRSVFHVVRVAAPAGGDSG